VLTLRHPDVDALVVELRQLYVGAGIGLAVEMGRVIIERLFGGDVARWKYRGRKDISFRKLEKHPSLPFHASTLSRSVAIYMLSRRRADLTGFRHIGPSHLYEIAALPEADQDRLLAWTEAEKWSTRKLRQEVAGIAIRTPRRRGDPAFAKWLRTARTGLDLRRATLEIETIDFDEAKDLLDAARGVLQHVEVLARQLGGRIRSLEPRRPSDIVRRVPASPHARRASRSIQTPSLT
jgi:hypothetical protein